MPQDELTSNNYGLTELQLKILQRFRIRTSTKEIANELGISEAWVSKNLMLARRKLDVGSSAEAARIVCGGERESIKKYYYQKTDLSDSGLPDDKRLVGAGGRMLAAATSDKPLINSFGPFATIAAIVLVAVGSITGVTLVINSGQGLLELWRAFGH